MKFINFLALLLVVIGALNWGMVGFFDINVVSKIFSPMVSKIIYMLVGLAGLWAITFFNKLCCCRHHPNGVCQGCNKDCDHCHCCKK